MLRDVLKKAIGSHQTVEAFRRAATVWPPFLKVDP
jgi:hypothetical protein